MKKIHVLTSLMLLFGFQVHAQLTVSTVPQNKTVLLESLAGMYNGYSPDGSKRADQLIAANPGLVNHLEYHVAPYATPQSGQNHYDLRTAHGAQINTASDPSGYPAGSVNRMVTANSMKPGKTAMGRQYWVAAASTVLSQPSPVNLNVSASLNTSNGNLEVEVAIYYTSTVTAPHHINVALTQDSIIGYQSGATSYPARVLPNGQFIQMNVLRDYITPQWGQAITNRNQGNQTNLTFTYIPGTINNIPFDFDNMHVVAYITTGANYSEVVTAKTHNTITSGGPSGCASYTYSKNSNVVTFTSTSTCQNATSYKWDFGDLTTGTGSYAVHSYTANGSYPVKLIAYDLLLNAIDSITYYVVINSFPPPASCQASFTKSQARDANNNLIPGNVVISNTSIGNNLNYTWSFGDSSTSNQMNPPAHTYTGNGPYILCLTVSDSSCFNTYCDTLSVDSNGVVSKRAPGFTLHFGKYTPTGISDIDKVEYKLYPNPSKGQVFVEFESDQSDEIEINVYNITGKLVQNNRNGISNGSNRLLIDLSNQQKGLYFVKIQLNDSVVSKKIMIE